MINQLKKIGFKLDQTTGVWQKKNQVNFSYSDGDDIENYLLDSIRNCKDKSISSVELNQYIKDWPTLYHLSRRRSNIIRPFASFLKGKKVLEIGCGCGALSRFLGEVGAELIAVEGSSRRALITRERCKDLKNVNVVAATSELVADLRELDVVILNGVLEYSPKYLGVNGHLTLLKTVFNQLNEKGKLILSIENQMGLKYFAGQPEDHAGQPMYGINDSYREGEFKTWGKKELKEILKRIGFKKIDQYIPLPDYKLPISIITPFGWENFSEELVPLAIDSICEDPQRKNIDLFSMEKSYISTWKNGLASDLANSFLFIANREDKPGKIIATDSVAFSFKDNFEIGVNEGIEFKKEKKNSEITLNYFQIDQVEGNLKYTRTEIFRSKESYLFKLLQIVNQTGWDLNDILVWVKPWIEALKNEAYSQDGRVESMKIDKSHWNSVPVNCVLIESNKILLPRSPKNNEEIDLTLVIYHGLKLSLERISSVNKIEDNIELTRKNIVQYIFSSLLNINIDEEQLIELEKKELSISKKIILENTHFNKDIIQQRESLEDLQNRATALDSTLKQVTNSVSWKITRPLRKLIRLIL